MLCAVDAGSQSAMIACVKHVAGNTALLKCSLKQVEWKILVQSVLVSCLKFIDGFNFASMY